MLALLSGILLQPAVLCSLTPSLQSRRAVDAIKACGRDTTAALALLAELRSSSSADVYTYATAVSVCGKGDRWQEAIGLLDSMEADGLAPDRACFNAALAAAARARRPAEARALLKRMVDSGLEPAASSYVAVARAAMHANEFHAALATIEELRQAAQPVEFPALQVELVANEGLLTQTADGPSSAARHQRIAELVSESLKLHQATPLKEADATWLWRLYARTTLRAIRTRVATGTGLSSSRRRAVDHEATSRLLAALSASASSGEMPRFDEAGALAGYTTFHLINRAGKVADLLRVAASSKRRLSVASPSWSAVPSAVLSAVPSALPSVVAPAHGCSGAPCRAPVGLAPSVVVSLGGGPAYDFAALAMLRAYEAMEAGTGEGEPLQVHVLDFELGWKADAEAVSEATCTVLSTTLRGGGGGGGGGGGDGIGGRLSGRLDNGVAHQMLFGKCDLTQPLEAVSNAAVRSALPHARLFICSYVICENAQRLRATGYTFFADLMAAAAPGTVLAFSETTHRQFPELIEAARRGVVAGGGASVLETSLPSLKGKGGSQCLLYKRALSEAQGGGDSTERESSAIPSAPSEAIGGNQKSAVPSALQSHDLSGRTVDQRSDQETVVWWTRTVDQENLLERFSAQDVAHRRSGRVHVAQNRPSRGAY